MSIDPSESPGQPPAALAPCPFCAEPIRAAAQKCRYCGEYVAESRPDGRRPSREMRVQPSNDGQRGLATLLSILIPGAGLFLRGRIGLGFAVLFGTAVCFWTSVLVAMASGNDTIGMAVALIANLGAIMLYVTGIVFSALRVPYLR